jgi:hypothetical protein
MNNPVVRISNGLMIVQSYPLNWVRESVYANSNTEPYYYQIYIGDMSGGHICVYKEEDSELSISDVKFRVDSIEDAGEIVLKAAKAIGKSFEGTVYETIAEIRNKKIEKILK